VHNFTPLYAVVDPISLARLGTLHTAGVKF
jgi:hypothetical protein